MRKQKQPAQKVLETIFEERKKIWKVKHLESAKGFPNMMITEFKRNDISSGFKILRP